MRRLLFGAILAAAIPATSFAGPKSKDPKLDGGRFVPFTPLSAAELYAKRMRFEDGEPIISVGLMEGQSEVRLEAEGPARLMFEEQGLPKTIYVPPPARFRLRPLGVRSPEIRYWVIVDTRSYVDVKGSAAAAKEWKQAGLQTKQFEVGTIVGLSGNVLDTRERRLGVGGFRKLASARRVVERLFRDRKLKASIHEELVRVPVGEVGVYDDSGKLLHKADSSVCFGTVEGGRVVVKGVEHGRGYKSHGFEDRSYGGHVYVVLDKTKKLSVLNSVGAEQLLYGLVPAEIFATSPAAALEAQAVTARGEIFSKLGHRHFGEPFHLCSEQHCQVYAGARYEREAPTKAVNRTRGLLAVRPKKDKKAKLRLVDSVYSSTCGGFSEANEVVWDHVASPSLRPRMDGSASDPALKPFANGLTEKNVRAFVESYPPSACARSSFVRANKFRWKKKLSAARLNKLVAHLNVGEVKDLKILGRGKGGRITGVRIVGSQGQRDVLRELPVRRLFGRLNSGMFVIDRERQPRTGRLNSVTFVGGGWGHGSGMCQIGAIGRAERGATFRQILSHYYNGATVEKIY